MAKKIKFSSISKVKKTKNKSNTKSDSHDGNVSRIDELIKRKEKEKQDEQEKERQKREALKQKEEEKAYLEKEKQRQKEERLKEIKKQKLDKQKQKETKIQAKNEEKQRILNQKKLRQEEKLKQVELKKKQKEYENKNFEKKRREAERLKKLELKALEKKKQDEEKLKSKQEKIKKGIFKPKKFDQSEIEVVKKHDENETKTLSELEVDKTIDYVKEGNIVYERKGYGWKGQGSRKIVFDDNTKQYMYLVYEPELSDEEEKIKERLIHLFRVRADVDVFEIDINVKKQHLQNALENLMMRNKIELDEVSKDKIFYYIFREFIGYGKIDIMMKDEVVEDISCDGHNIPIFIYHKDYENIKSNVVFEDVEDLTSFVIKLSQMCGKQISVYEPVVDGKLSDGSRLQTTLGKTITKYSTFTIRRFREDPLTPIDLIKNNTMSIEMAAYFWMTIEKGASVLFCGGTASGKTTALNALSLFLPFSYKIVSVEDTREINLPHENWIAGTTRTGFSSSEQSKTGKDIDMFDLIRVALRQRPKAIIVGEVRGKEAYSLFQAMTTGHLSYSTVHASDMHSLIQRLESPPISLPRALLTSLDLVVFLNSLTVQGKPVRRITNVTEIIKLDPETNRLVTISPFYWMSEIDDKFQSSKGSQLLNKIKLQNMWDDKKLETELKNRIKVLKWMIDNKLRSYKDVGRVISDYYNDAKSVLKKVEDSK